MNWLEAFLQEKRTELLVSKNVLLVASNSGKQSISIGLNYIFKTVGSNCHSYCRV